MVDGTFVDGKARLDDIAAAPDLLRRLRAIRDEGARFNIATVYRNLNDPTFALMFLDPAAQGRFTFKLAGQEKINGTDTVTLTFFEQKKPTLVRTHHVHGGVLELPEIPDVLASGGRSLGFRIQLTNERSIAGGYS